MSKLIANIRLEARRDLKQTWKRRDRTARRTGTRRPTRGRYLLDRRRRDLGAHGARGDALHAPTEVQCQHHVEHDVGDVQYDGHPERETRAAEPDQPAEERIGGTAQACGAAQTWMPRNNRARAPSTSSLAPVARRHLADRPLQHYHRETDADRDQERPTEAFLHLVLVAGADCLARPPCCPDAQEAERPEHSNVKIKEKPTATAERCAGSGIWPTTAVSTTPPSTGLTSLRVLRASASVKTARRARTGMSRGERAHRVSPAARSTPSYRMRVSWRETRPRTVMGTDYGTQRRAGPRLEVHGARPHVLTFQPASENAHVRRRFDRCPHCDTTNRVPRAKLEQGLKAVCGRCKQPLPAAPAAAPLTVTDATFAAEVERSPLPVPSMPGRHGAGLAA